MATNKKPIRLENEMHLWTIQDAKDGDVLVSNDASYIVLFKGLSYLEDNIDRFKSYCHYCRGILSLIEDPSWCCNAFHPAAKEQRDTLMKAMADAGYAFDFENKELKKIELDDKIVHKFNVGDIVQYITDSTDRRKIEEIDTLCNMYHTDSSPIMFEVEDEWKVVVNAEDVEQNPAEWSEEDDKKAERIIRLLQEAYDINCINGSIDWLKFLRDRVQSKVEWSEEDNLQLQAAIDICKSSGHTITSDWLKYLKDRVQPKPNQEWSEEAQQIIKDAACFIFTCANTAETKEEEERLEELADKLQDLRPQNIWKPSELQIEALESATANCAYSEYVDCLKELIKQLKQL